ncbi:LuxR C-terminal-related transcriptional regulator [Paenibacillus piri]|uniref:GAF domain-containing protein n=1 Tax=Paenibacillus piri TaxID=2547395 RepID=A0A4R5KP58_9BACL|nr:LuxR C-terminal-related transcriptional regulator [Paenibacillus piri]TDF97082.1 GAF domain-containing protein [Paenibacillus piri]
MLPPEIMRAFKGMFPSTIVTVSRDDIPNIANLTRVWPVDNEHIAIANQFLNKTLINLNENPLAMLKMADPNDLLHWELELRYIRFEAEGPLYTRVQHDLQAVYWMAGAPDSVPLRSVLLFQVLSARKCLEEASHLLPEPELYGDLLDILAQTCGWSRSTYWIAQEGESSLRLIASRDVPGAGTNEAAFEPMKRMAALVKAEQRMVRLYNIHSQLRYIHTIRTEGDVTSSSELPEGKQVKPGLQGSLLGMPVMAYGTLIGVVCCEGTGGDTDFDRLDERYLMLLSGKLGEAIFAIASVPEQERRQMFRQVIERAQLEWSKATDPFYTLLSARERQVSIYVAKGHTNVEIAQALYISKRTVTTHMERIFQKLQVASRAALTRYVVEKELHTDNTNGSFR